VDSNASRITSEQFSFLLLDLRERVEQLFLYELFGDKFVFRPLYLSELDSIASLSETIPEYIIDEWIIAKALLLSTCGKDYLLNDAPAGAVEALSSSVLLLSSPGDIQVINKSLEEERAKIGTDKGLIENTILAGTGNILGKEHKRITAREQSKYLVLAESTLGRKLEIQTPTTSTDKKGRKKQMSPEAAAILSREAADKPDFDADNKMFRAL